MGSEGGGLANLFMAAQGAQAAAGVASTYHQVQADRAEGRYGKQLAMDEAAMRDIQARDAVRQGERASALRGIETRDLIGRQAAAAAGQGVDLSSGSVQAAMGDAAAYGALDAEMEANNAWRTAFGLKSEAQDLRRAGRNAKASADNKARMTSISGGLQFGRDAIGAADKYSRFRSGAKKYVAPPAGKNMSDPRNR